MSVPPESSVLVLGRIRFPGRHSAWGKNQRRGACPICQPHGLHERHRQLAGRQEHVIPTAVGRRRWRSPQAGPCSVLYAQWMMSYVSSLPDTVHLQIQQCHNPHLGELGHHHRGYALPVVLRRCHLMRPHFPTRSLCNGCGRWCHAGIPGQRRASLIDPHTPEMTTTSQDRIGDEVVDAKYQYSQGKYKDHGSDPIPNATL